MEQLKIFLKGVAQMLIILSLFITCIGAITSGDKFFLVIGIISIIYLIYKTYKYIRDSKRN